VSNQPHRITTAEELARFNAAREGGGCCAACGRILSGDEPVYIEQMLLDRNAFASSGARWSQVLVRRDAPLGSECVSPALLIRLEGRAPEQCEACGRPVYYAKTRAQRRRAICSHVCRNRADRAAQRRPLSKGVVSDDRLRIETEDERERLHAARRNGGMCAACGRALDDGEPVYIERFVVVRSYVHAPVGRECASHGVLARMGQVEPERCIGCERRIYYGRERITRRKAVCSQRCRARAWQSEQRKGVD
jgi:hypothetical protein